MIYEEYIRLLRQMVQTPSLSFREEEVCSLIRGALDSFGIEYRTYRGNVVAVNRNFSKGRKTIALDAHLDTVPACGGYTFDPFDPGNDDGLIRGLGSNDDGGSVVSMIAAFRHFHNRELPFNLMLVLTREEECSGPDGAAWLYSEAGPLRTELAYPDHVIVGEPTDMKAATSERGLLVIDALARGVSGHAARGDGENALYKAIGDIEALRGHVFSRRSPIMGEVRLNVTQIEAGTAHNVIPDSCRFVVDVRPTEMYDNAELLAELQELCSSELKARNLANRSSATSEGSPLLRAVERLGIESYSSPTTSDWMRIGCDALKMGPGSSSRSHRPDEYILVSEITDAIEKYIRFIDCLYGDTLE